MTVRCGVVICGPVIVVTGGTTTHNDVRLNSIRNAVEFAQEAGLFGLICDCLPLLQERSQHHALPFASFVAMFCRLFGAFLALINVGRVLCQPSSVFSGLHPSDQAKRIGRSFVW